MKRSSIGLLNGLGATSLARLLQERRAVVLTYHGVLEGSADYDYLNHNFISSDEFDAQMRYLCEYYRPISLRELVAAYRAGRTPPPRSVVVTFDDGFANNYTVAYPILRRHSVPFAVFVTTGLIDSQGAMLWTERGKRALYFYPGESVSLRFEGIDLELDLRTPSTRADACKAVIQRMKRLAPAARDRALDALEAICGSQPVRHHERDRYDFLTWAQVKEMADAGVEIGSHTVNHPILTTLEADTLQSELWESKQRIEAVLGRECYAFAYPNGSAADFGSREKEALRACGYTCGLSLKGTLNDLPDLYEIDRVNIGRHLDMDAFRVATTGLLGVARRTRDRIVAGARTMPVSQRGRA